MGCWPAFRVNLLCALPWSPYPGVLRTRTIRHAPLPLLDRGWVEDGATCNASQTETRVYAILLGPQRFGGDDRRGPTLGARA